MDNSRTHFALAPIFLILICSISLSVNGNPVYLNDRYKYITNASYKLDCNPVEYSEKDVIIFENKDLFLKSKKLIINSKNYLKENKKIFICPRFVNISSENTVLNCKHKFGYEKNEYEILQNGSALVHGAIILKEEYMMKDEDLLTCVQDYYDNDDDDNVTSTSPSLSDISIEISKIGSGVSILALIIHLLTFSYLPTLRNLPGCNLASLSVAFLLAYSFFLIGQIPEVLGVFCIISAALQQNFFLAAFFCMNVLAFDVWRTLKLATEKLVVGSQNARKRQFLWYTLYSWGCPLLITTITVIVDNVNCIPHEIKPFYGKDDVCWLANTTAKTIFFAAPAFTLFVINGIFFIRSSWIISNNTMKFPSDHNKQDVKLNYILYVRLAIMMGLTWLIGVIALISNNKIVWFIVDILNSLQGLFLFLLFTCTRKVMKRVIEKANSKKSMSEKHSAASSNSSNVTSKH